MDPMHTLSWVSRCLAHVRLSHSTLRAYWLLALTAFEWTNVSISGMLAVCLRSTRTHKAFHRMLQIFQTPSIALNQVCLYLVSSSLRTAPRRSSWASRPKDFAYMIFAVRF